MRTSRLAWGAFAVGLVGTTACSDEKPADDPVAQTEQSVDSNTGTFTGRVKLNGSDLDIESTYNSSFIRAQVVAGDPSGLYSETRLNAPVPGEPLTERGYELEVQIGHAWDLWALAFLKPEAPVPAYDRYYPEWITREGPIVEGEEIPGATIEEPVGNVHLHWVKTCDPGERVECTDADEITAGSLGVFRADTGFRAFENGAMASTGVPISAKTVPMRDDRTMKLSTRYGACDNEFLDQVYYRFETVIDPLSGASDADPSDPDIDVDIFLGDPVDPMDPDDGGCTNSQTKPDQWYIPPCAEQDGCGGAGGAGGAGGSGTGTGGGGSPPGTDACPYNTVPGYGCADGLFRYVAEAPAGIGSFDEIKLVDNDGDRDGFAVRVVADEGPHGNRRPSHIDRDYKGDPWTAPPAPPLPPDTYYFHFPNLVPSSYYTGPTPWAFHSYEAPRYRVGPDRPVELDASLGGAKAFVQLFQGPFLENLDRIAVMEGGRTALDRTFVFEPGYVQGDVLLAGTDFGEAFLADPDAVPPNRPAPDVWYLPCLGDGSFCVELAEVQAYGCGGKEGAPFEPGPWDRRGGWRVCGGDAPSPEIYPAGGASSHNSLEIASVEADAEKRVRAHYTMPLAAVSDMSGGFRKSRWDARYFRPAFVDFNADPNKYINESAVIINKEAPLVTLSAADEIHTIDQKYCVGNLTVFIHPGAAGAKLYQPWINQRGDMQSVPAVVPDSDPAGDAYVQDYIVRGVSALGTPFTEPEAVADGSAQVNVTLPIGSYRLGGEVMYSKADPEQDDRVAIPEFSLELTECGEHPTLDCKCGQCIKQEIEDGCTETPSAHFTALDPQAERHISYSVNGGTEIEICNDFDPMAPSCDGDVEFDVDPLLFTLCDNTVAIIFRDEMGEPTCEDPIGFTVEKSIAPTLELAEPLACYEDELAAEADLELRSTATGCSPVIDVDVTEGAGCAGNAHGVATDRCEATAVDDEPVAFCHLEPPQYPELESCYATWAEAEAAISAALPGYTLSFSHSGEDRPGHACAGTLHVETEICDTTYPHDYPVTIGRVAPELPEMPEGCYASQAAFLDAVRAATITDCGSADLALAATPSGDVCDASLAVSASYGNCPGLGDSHSYPNLVFEDVKPPPMVDITPPIMCYADEPALRADLPSRTSASGCLVGDPLIDFDVIGGPGTCDATSTASVRDVCGKTDSDAQAEQYCGPGEPTWPDLAACYGSWDEAEDIIRAANPAHVLVFTRIGEDAPGHACAGKLLVETKACDTPYSHSYDLQIGRKAPMLPEDKPPACFSDIGAFLDWVRDGTKSDCGSDDLVLSYLASSETCAADITVTASYGECPELGLEDSELYAGLMIDGTPPTVTEGTIAACWLTLADAEAAARAATGVSDNCASEAELRANMTHNTTGSPCDATIAVTTTDACGLAAAPPAVYDDIHADAEPPVLSETDPAMRDLEWCDLVNDAEYRPVSMPLPPDPNDPAAPSSPEDWFCFDSSRFMTMTDNCDASLDLLSIAIKDKCERDCKEDKEECKDACDDARTECRAACPAGGAGNDCRKDCDDARKDCDEQCNADETACNITCGGGKCQKACNEARHECRDECKDTRDECRAACPAGGAGAACRDACEDARKDCDEDCDEARDACRDACPNRAECRAACDDDREICDDGCDATRDACRAACPAGGAGAACRSACDDARDTCKDGCEDVRNECRDDCDLDAYDVIDLEADGVLFFDGSSDRFCLHREFFPEDDKKEKLLDVDGEMRFVAEDACNTSYGEADFTIEKCNKCGGQPRSCEE